MERRQVNDTYWRWGFVHRVRVCVKACSMACIVLEEEKAVFKGEKRCMTCAHCMAVVCPQKAVYTDRYDNSESVEMTPDIPGIAGVKMKTGWCFAGVSALLQQKYPPGRRLKPFWMGQIWRARR